MSGIFVEHIFVTALGGTLGLLVGGVLGYALALIIIRLYSASVGSMKAAVFIPWRTALASLLIPHVIPTVLLFRYGIGNQTGTLSVGIAVAGLILAWTCGIFIGKEFPRSQRVELVAMSRSVFIAAAALLAAFGPYGTSGLGIVLLQRIRILQHDEAFDVFLIIVVAILVFDLGIGAFQYFVAFARPTTSDRSSASSKA